MLFYSFLGFLTLQIGVAVSGIAFIILAILIAIANLPNIDTSPRALPTNYIVMGVFIIVLLITGLTLFIAAYFENRKYCLCAVVLLVVTLIVFLVASGISFYNDPSLTKHVCFPDHKCPETLWLPRVKYRTLIGSWKEDEVYQWDEITSTEIIPSEVSDTPVSDTPVSSTTPDETTHGNDTRRRVKAKQGTSALTYPRNKHKNKHQKTDEEPEELPEEIPSRGKGRKGTSVLNRPRSRVSENKHPQTDEVGEVISETTDTEESEELPEELQSRENARKGTSVLNRPRSRVSENKHPQTYEVSEVISETTATEESEELPEELQNRENARKGTSVLNRPRSRVREKEHPQTNKVSGVISETTTNEEPEELPEEIPSREKASKDQSVLIEPRSRLHTFKKAKTVSQRELSSTETLLDLEYDKDVVESLKRSVLYAANHLKGDSSLLKRKEPVWNDDVGEDYYYGGNSTDEELIDFETSEESNYIFGLKFFLVVAFFIIILLCLVFAIPLVLSYRKQLYYIRLYSINPSSAHYLVD